MCRDPQEGVVGKQCSDLKQFLIRLELQRTKYVQDKKNDIIPQSANARMLACLYLVPAPGRTACAYIISYIELHVARACKGMGLTLMSGLYNHDKIRREPPQ